VGDHTASGSSPHNARSFRVIMEQRILRGLRVSRAL
jgi:hypothetical protein